LLQSRQVLSLDSTSAATKFVIVLLNYESGRRRGRFLWFYACICLRMKQGTGDEENHICHEPAAWIGERLVDVHNGY
jgi:hypothetical protein